ncbi:cation/H(+) antiporter 15-like [Senna tora]|uniref:Cation/H(+) antiporter 15-like n=1 Tax=Senna tora TaxID=362788 RepID=A0A834W4Z1_9FABA|nr:cation/H(+) antiporter 15-like [Senna tora]
MNLDNMLQVQKKTTSVAILGIVIPMVIGMSFFALIQKLYQKHDAHENYSAKAGYLIWSLVLTFTGFPVLARILADLKLLYTRIGKAALSVAMVSDTYGWIMFIMLIPFSSDSEKAVWSVLGTMIFVLLCIFVLRPLIPRFIRKRIDQDNLNDSELLFVLMGAFVFSYITEFIGTHSIVGAFVYGLILPHGRFTDLVMGKLDKLISGVISPIFFFRSGIMVNVVEITQQRYWLVMVFVILFLSILKVVSSLVATFFFHMPTRDSVGIGLLLNTKGVLALLMLSIALERKVLSEVAFSVMMCAIFIMTIAVPLLINTIYKPRKWYRYRQNTIEKLRMDAELRVLTCIHNNLHATSMVNFLRATRIMPLHVFGVHLVESIEHNAAMLYVADMEHPIPTSSRPQDLTQSQAELKSITNTFSTLIEKGNNVKLETSNVVSAFETIHKDIFNLAKQKGTSLILLPFHKRQSLTGHLETTNEAYRGINLNVLRDSPCSVAIFIDRGIGSLSKTNLRILMLFVGGPDDREALAIAWRMARHAGNHLLMVRILLLGEAAEIDISEEEDENQWLPSIVNHEERQKKHDDECVNSFRFKAVCNNDSITYSEKKVHSGDELTSLLHELDNDKYDLYIVGQGSGRNSLFFSKLLEWSDNPELGVIGDMVASNSFGTKSSLLVVQQFWPQGLKFCSQSQHRKQTFTKTDGLAIV